MNLIKLSTLLLTIISSNFIFASDVTSKTTDEEVIAWATETAIAAYNYDALSYKKKFTSLKNKFTKSGWDSFETALKDSGNLETVIKNNVVVSAYRNNPAKIESFTKNTKSITWVVKVPTQVTYVNESITMKQNMETYLTIDMTSSNNIMLVQNINSTLVEPTVTAKSEPVPRPNCKIATSQN
jgi:hypothetical protein